MSTFDLMPDAPGLLRAESINIQLKFERTSATTGRVSWNIPTPATGCAADQQAYCGMLVTLDTKPSTIDKIPSNGTVYSSDPSADANLFAGDRLQTALVIGAFYNDRTTVMFDITGIKANTPYYVTGFPVDCQHRYFIEGVHAYSTEYVNRGTDDTHGTQVVRLNTNQAPTGAQPSASTTLDPSKQYSFNIQLGVDPAPLRAMNMTECVLVAPTHTITLDGSTAQSYDDLVESINVQLARLQTGPRSPAPPNAGGFYWNATTQKLYTWDGYVHTELPVIIADSTPNDVANGFMWLNSITGVLSVRDGASWQVVTVFELAIDPRTPVADLSYWFDGTTARQWNGTTWCNLTTYIQDTNPSSASTPAPGTFWYDESSNQLFKWNTALEMWFAEDAVQSTVDPAALPPGAYWFNSVSNVLSTWNTPNVGWNAVSNVSVSQNSPQTPAPGKYWYNPDLQQLYQRDVSNTTWTELDSIDHPTDPTIVSSCGIWWDIDANQLNVWDSLTLAWVVVANFISQPNDPAQPPNISEGSAWYNPTERQLYIFSNQCFVSVEFISWPTDPRTTLTPGVVWHNLANGNWFILLQDMTWDQFDPLVAAVDPLLIASGTFWFNSATGGLMIWNGAAWMCIMHSSTPFTPAVNQQWFDITTNMLMSWNGITWIAVPPLATVELDCNGNLLFTHSLAGSSSMIRLRDIDLFESLGPGAASIFNPSPGTDGSSDIPSYDELGIGTDGNDAARNALINEIRYELGYPVVNIELTKEQMDYAVTRALEELRSKSSICYTRGFFFMGIKAEEQKYFLTNKRSDMNKIVTVLGVYRMSSAFLSSAHGAGVYGQIVLQHMYNMGTFDLLSYHLMAEYTSLMEILFAARVTFTWNEQTRLLWIHQRFAMNERNVAIEATVERTEQDILTDRFCKTWIRRHAAATCRMMLAEVRGKFSSLPGAGGSVTLNASDLRQAAQMEFDALLAEIRDYTVDMPENFGNGTTFLFG